jgi:ubiquinone/menaquinone biosynthesis C-methylase UbiE
MDGVKAVVCNANDMAIFPDNYFDLVLSNAMLEHDKYFWKSIAEMRRVLKPGGVMIIGVPGYDSDPAKTHGIKTAVFKFHFKVDYYRFSDMCVRDLFFDGMEAVEVKSILSPARIIGVGIKPN